MAAGLWKLLDGLPRTHWPAFARGDCGYGNEVMMQEAETRALPYLFKLRHTAKVKTLVVQMQRPRSGLAGRGGRVGSP